MNSYYTLTFALNLTWQNPLVHRIIKTEGLWPSVYFCRVYHVPNFMAESNLTKALPDQSGTGLLTLFLSVCLIRPRTWAVLSWAGPSNGGLTWWKAWHGPAQPILGLWGRAVAGTLAQWAARHGPVMTLIVISTWVRLTYCCDICTYTGEVTCVKFGADAIYIAVGSKDANLRIFGIQSCQLAAQ